MLEISKTYYSILKFCLKKVFLKDISIYQVTRVQCVCFRVSCHLSTVVPFPGSQTVQLAVCCTLCALLCGIICWTQLRGQLILQPWLQRSSSPEQWKQVLQFLGLFCNWRHMLRLSGGASGGQRHLLLESEAGVEGGQLAAPGGRVGGWPTLHKGGNTIEYYRRRGGTGLWLHNMRGPTLSGAAPPLT